MKETLYNNRQVILYLDNKSYSTAIKCRECGHVLRCPNCKIPLVLHKEKNLARCNYCDYKIDQYSICEKCGSSNINTFGFGLEKVKEVITQYFPNKTILQVDSDILTKTDDYEKAIIDIEDGNVDIIIGTNILNKRINNYNIGLVCILSADRLLNSNDYRANEYTYNNIAKLINYDNLIIQTYYPNNEIIKYASTGDFDSYYEKEIERRKELQYFPFFEVNRITIQGEYKEMYHFANYFKKVYLRVVQGSVLGPVYDSKIKGIKLLLKHNDYEKVIKVYDDTKQAFREQKLLTSFERKPKVI
jgi:primosomal protein N' (replication factor Y)